MVRSRRAAPERSLRRRVFRRCWLSLLLLFLAVAAFPADLRAEPQAFTAQRFRAAQAQGRHILVYVAASWCSTCSLQEAALAETLTALEKNAELPDLVVLVVDFDGQKDIVARLGVQMQSTLIAYHGKTEIGRTIGVTEAPAIKSFLLASEASEAQRRAAAERLVTRGSYGLGFLAGLLSILSPCVLPLVPIIAAGAAAAHRWGVLALSAGLALSYAVIGMLLATLGFGLGLGNDAFRIGAALLMAVLGVLLLSAGTQERVALAGTGLANAADRLMTRLRVGGLEGEFLLGLLLGAIWTPCVGPTLAAAVTLAAQRTALAQVATTMLLFALGAALPLLLVGTLSRAVVARWRRRMGAAGRAGRIVLGLLLIVLAIAVLSGIDHRAEALMVRFWPAWLTRLSIGL